MPSAYTVVWCHNGVNRDVLLTRKRFTGARFNNVAIAMPQLLNGSGQEAFPGGDLNPGETAAAAGYREFLEETGIDLQLAATVAAYHIVHNHVVNHAPAHAFSTLFVQVASPVDLAALALAVNNNIVANVPADQELEVATVVTEANVIGMLGPNAAIPAGPAGWYGPPRMAQLNHQFRFSPVIGGPPIQVAAGYVAPGIRAQVTARLNDPFNWHVLSINSLPTAVGAAAAAAALALAPVPAPAWPFPVLPGWNLGLSRRQAQYLGALLALGTGVALHYLMQSLNPPDQA